MNFEINKGDKVGIIGRNGAGKSTPLKVLSRITEATTGKIHINGRIASLLEGLVLVFILNSQVETRSIEFDPNTASNKQIT